jgi:uncharacterized protein with PhoU and TrkA domain
MSEIRKRIETMIVELKDTSEMMIDLAYLALLYGKVEIAEHVIDLEEEMDNLHNAFELEVLNLNQTNSSKGILGLIRLGLAAENFADAATLIADAVVRGIKPHPVFRMAIEAAEETVLSENLTKDSTLVDKRLGQIGLEDDIGMRIICVRRNNKWTYNPHDDFVLKVGDTIIVRGYSEGKEKFRLLVNPKKAIE